MVSAMAYMCFVSVLAGVAALDADVIADIVSPAADERRALDIKAEQFWQVVQEAARGTKLDQHAAVYVEVEAAMSALPPENTKVREMLGEALMRLQRADEKVLKQALKSAEVASERLAAGPGPESLFSFLTGGQNFFSLAVRRFVGGHYAERVAQQISSRQAEILPTLRGAALVTGDVLTDCRLASKLGFDVLKYDVYNKGVPRTPNAAKEAANKLVDAAEQTRHLFMQGVVGVANAIARDTQEKDVSPSAKVTQTLLAGMVPFGAKAEEPSAGITVAREGQRVVAM